MKQSLFSGLFIIALLLAACNNSNYNVKHELVSELDSVSYAIGIEFAKNLPRDGFDTVKPWIVARGLEDYFKKNEYLIPDEEIIDFLKTYVYKLKSEKYLAKYGDIKLEGEKFLEENKKKEGITCLAGGLQYEVLKEGSGPKPGAKSLVKLHYKGWLLSGEVLEDHMDGDPVPFMVDRVIPGWAEALQEMNEGSRWKLFIPYDLGYGTEIRPNSKIVPYSTLIFEIELVEVGEE